MAGQDRKNTHQGGQGSQDQLVFGPVPSRRLGRSLGINNVASKVCTCACVYCQLGRTIAMQIERSAFHEPARLVAEVGRRVGRLADQGQEIDYLTFVPNGEPTLDVHLGREIELLRPLGKRIAVITNANLIWRDDVRSELLRADWVSLKMDAGTQALWERIDRPRGSLRLVDVLAGAREFAREYTGTLVTETMLVRGVNDGSDSVRRVVQEISTLCPDVVYLSIPTRPPAESWVAPPDEDALHRAYQIASQSLARVEYLIGYEGNSFASTGDVRRDLLGITAVHPMREDAVRGLVERERADWSVVADLVTQGLVLNLDYEGHTYYVRRLGKRYARGTQ